MSFDHSVLTIAATKPEGASARALAGLGVRVAPVVEDAVEADPSLLFDRPVELLARQHYVYAHGVDRHFVDMVFHDAAADEVILVELKRGRLEAAHHQQLVTYLDRVRESAMLRTFLDDGARLRGVLATVVDCDLSGCRDDVTVAIADRERVIAILQRLRQAQRRLSAGDDQ